MQVPLVEAQIKKSVYSTTRFVGRATELPVFEVKYEGDDGAVHDVASIGRQDDIDLNEEYDRLCRKFGARDVHEVYGRLREGRLKATIEGAQKEFAPRGKPRGENARATA